MLLLYYNKCSYQVLRRCLQSSLFGVMRGRSDCPCAKLVKLYVMKMYWGVEVTAVIKSNKHSFLFICGGNR
jgi:hypothetical protein